MSDITIKQAQADIDQWIKTVGVKYFNELTNLGILMEEVGELSRLMVRQYGEQSFKETDKGKELSDEMADRSTRLLRRKEKIDALHREGTHAFMSKQIGRASCRERV